MWVVGGGHTCWHTYKSSPHQLLYTFLPVFARWYRQAQWQLRPTLALKFLVLLGFLRANILCVLQIHSCLPACSLSSTTSCLLAHSPPPFSAHLPWQFNPLALIILTLLSLKTALSQSSLRHHSLFWVRVFAINFSKLPVESVSCVLDPAVTA